MCDPGTVMSGMHLPYLVLQDFLERVGVRRGVALDRYLRGHAAHRVDAAAVAGADQQVYVRFQEVTIHRHARTVGQHEFRPAAEFLDEAEDVIPAPAVESRGMITQLVEDFVHLEGGGDRLDQHRRADRPARGSQRRLRGDEDVVPQPGFEVALELRQVEVRTRAFRDQRSGVVEEEQAEVEQRPRHRLAVYQHMPLDQMPAARPHHQRRHCRIQGVLLLGRLEFDRPRDRVPQIDLAVDRAVPRGRVRVLEIRHIGLRARVERVDDHLAVHGPGDLDASIAQVVRNRGDAPVRVANVSRALEERRERAGIEVPLPVGTAAQQVLAPLFEGAREPRDKSQRLGRQKLVEARVARSPDFYVAADGGGWHGGKHGGKWKWGAGRGLDGSSSLTTNSPLPMSPRWGWGDLRRTVHSSGLVAGATPTACGHRLARLDPPKSVLDFAANMISKARAARLVAGA